MPGGRARTGARAVKFSRIDRKVSRITSRRRPRSGNAGRTGCPLGAQLVQFIEERKTRPTVQAIAQAVFAVEQVVDPLDAGNQHGSLAVQLQPGAGEQPLVVPLQRIGGEILARLIAPLQLPATDLGDQVETPEFVVPELVAGAGSQRALALQVVDRIVLLRIAAAPEPVFVEEAIEVVVQLPVVLDLAPVLLSRSTSPASTWRQAPWRSRVSPLSFHSSLSLSLRLLSSLTSRLPSQTRSSTSGRGGTIWRILASGTVWLPPSTIRTMPLPAASRVRLRCPDTPCCLISRGLSELMVSISFQSISTWPA